MTEILFYLFATMAVGMGLSVVLARTAVSSAVCMIFSLLAVAGLFLLLQAYFLAALQVLVYAGAIMVVFLFIIMLVDSEDKKRDKWDRKKWAFLGASLVGFFLLLGGVVTLFYRRALPASALPLLEDSGGFVVLAKSFGFYLFTKYLLPVQAVGLLLLMAMVGVVVLSKRFTLEKREEKKEN